MAIIEKGKSHGHTIENTHTSFESIDMNGDGFLSELEIKDGLRRLNIGLSGQEIVLLLKQIRLTKNRDGDISYEELTEALHGDREFTSNNLPSKATMKRGVPVKKKAQEKETS